LDDDVEVSETWLTTIQLAFRSPEVCLVGGPSIPYFSVSPPEWLERFAVDTPYGGRMNTWLSLLDIGKDVDNIDPTFIFGLNFSIRKSILINCGGFHPDLVPKQFQRWQGDGETGLTLKLRDHKYRAVYRQAAQLFHHCGKDRLHLNYFKKRAFYQGVCDSFTIVRNGKDPVFSRKK